MSGKHSWFVCEHNKMILTFCDPSIGTSHIYICMNVANFMSRLVSPTLESFSLSHALVSECSMLYEHTSLTHTCLVILTLMPGA